MAEERTSRVRLSIQQNIAVQQTLLANEDLVELIAAVGGEFVKALRGGHKIILFGNGGSAADAQHIAAEFVGRFQLERPPLPALALTVNTSALTCIGNDYQYEDIFGRQMMALGSEGDVAVGISTSGKSLNVLRGLDVARTKGLVTIGFTGKDSAELSKYVQYCISVPSEATPRIQETHILIGHILCEITDAELASR